MIPVPDCRNEGESPVCRRKGHGGARELRPRTSRPEPLARSPTAQACPSARPTASWVSWPVGARLSAAMTARGTSGSSVGNRLFRVPPVQILRDVALPYMQDLYEGTHENIQLAVRRRHRARLRRAHCRAPIGRPADQRRRPLPARRHRDGPGAARSFAGRHPGRRARRAAPRLHLHTVTDPRTLRAQLTRIRRDHYLVSDRQLFETTSRRRDSRADRPDGAGARRPRDRRHRSRRRGCPHAARPAHARGPGDLPSWVVARGWPDSRPCFRFGGDRPPAHRVCLRPSTPTTADHPGAPMPTHPVDVASNVTTADASIDVTTDVPVAIVGAGPAGLMLAHRLARAGVASVAIDLRTRHRSTRPSAPASSRARRRRDLVETGVSDRILRDGHEHGGTDLRFEGRSHRSTSRRSWASPSGSTPRPTSSSTSPTPASGTAARSTSG